MTEILLVIPLEGETVVERYPFENIDSVKTAPSGHLRVHFADDADVEWESQLAEEYRVVENPT